MSHLGGGRRGKLENEGGGGDGGSDNSDIYILEL